MQPVAEFRTKRAVALDLLRDAIISQKIHPGSRLILEELTQQFGLSMTPIREALPALEAEGLIIQTPHKGAIVTRMDVEEIHELYAMRIGLEGMVARHAVPKLTEDDLVMMETCLQQMNEHRGDWARFLEHDKALHSRLYRAAGSQRWLDTIDTLWTRCSRYMLVSTAMLGAEGAISDDHREIIGSCRVRDSDGVSEAIGAHLTHSRDRLLCEWS
jgi:DNA-binding GntR family transcriptional regulator